MPQMKRQISNISIRNFQFEFFMLILFEHRERASNSVPERKLIIMQNRAAWRSAWLKCYPIIHMLLNFLYSEISSTNAYGSLKDLTQAAECLFPSLAIFWFCHWRTENLFRILYDIGIHKAWRPWLHPCLVMVKVSLLLGWPG